MDVRLSPEQKALRDSAVQVVDRLCPKAVGQLDDVERAAKLDAAVAAAGWRELRAPTDDGTPWASGVEVAIVAEQLGRGAADVAFVGPTLAAELRRLAGAPAATEPETVLLSVDLHSFGNAIAIDVAGAARALTVHGNDVVAVPIRPTDANVDLTRPSAVPAGVEEPIGNIVVDYVERVANLGLAIACADLVGVMQGAVDLAVAYATERTQYGQPVGSFQAVQHLLADALVLTEGSRSATLHAAWAVDAQWPADVFTPGAVAKAYAGRAARTVCETAIQVHGGIGNTWECMAHVLLRRALVSTELFGGVDDSLHTVLTANEA